MLSGRGLCVGLIIRPGQSYQVYVYTCVCVSFSVTRPKNKPLHLQWVGRRGQTKNKTTSTLMSGKTLYGNLGCVQFIDWQWSVCIVSTTRSFSHFIYIVSDRWMSTEHICNDIDRGETKYSEKNTSVSSPTINPTWASLKLNPNHCIETPATNSLSHGKAASVHSLRTCQQDRIFGFYYQYFS